MRDRDYLEMIERLISDGTDPGMIPQGIKQYFHGHFPRFEAHMRIFDQIVERVSLVYDFGTGFPFTSYYFVIRDNAKVVYGCNEADIGFSNSAVIYQKINLCNRATDDFFTDLIPADLTICTEVLEHLPCNVIQVGEFLKSTTNKYLLLSFPLGGVGAGNYEANNLGDHNKTYSEHLREFTRATAKEFCERLEMQTVEILMSNQPAYKAPIMNVLLKRWT